MSQDISKISQSSVQQVASANNSGGPAVQQQQKHSSGNDHSVKKSTTDSVAINAANNVQSERLQRIQEGVVDKNTLATRIRQTDSALDAVSSQIQAMKDNLSKIVKNYPPFAIDSKERMEILRSFISLRKEIDSMTIPAPPPQAGTQLTSKIWQDKGLDSILPVELATNAPDAQVHSAYQQLDNSSQVIAEGKQELQSTFNGY